MGNHIWKNTFQYPFCCESAPELSNKLQTATASRYSKFNPWGVKMARFFLNIPLLRVSVKVEEFNIGPILNTPQTK